MKTNRVLLLFLLVIGIAACQTPYRIFTHVHKDGSIQKTIYAQADSAFMADKDTNKLFPFELDSSWTISRYDSAIVYPFFGDECTFNAMIRKDFRSFDDYSNTVRIEAERRALFVPKESLEKRFRWFYTYYDYTGIFPEIADKGPVPMDDFISEQEQKLLFQGDFSSSRGMNGLELNDRLNDLVDRFWEWYLRSQYEISYSIILDYLNETGEGVYRPQLPIVKEDVYPRISLQSNDSLSFEPEDVCRLLDKYFDTDYFTHFPDEVQQEFDASFEDSCKGIDLFEYIVAYDLLLPGQIRSTNALSTAGDTLCWKVDAYRMLADDYVLQAVTRTRNDWAFAITLLAVLGIGYWLIRRAKNAS